MTRTVVDAEIEVFKPDNGTSTPDFTVPAADIRRVGITERIGDLKDTGSIEIDNTGGAYTGASEITTGDKLVFRVQLEGEMSLSDRWTAVARPPQYQSGPGLQRLTIEAEDFVFAVLSWRIAFNSFEGAAISGSGSAILETLLSNNASEIGTGQIQSVGVSTDYIADGKGLLEMVSDLAALGDAATYNDGTDLVFEPISSITATLSVDSSTADFGTFTVSGHDDQLANQVRVDGGISQAIDDQQTTQSNTQTVTESSRLTHQLSTRKSEIDRIELYTVTTGSGESITVRLQKDDAGAPVAVGDRESDIVRKTLDSAFLDSNGFTTFIFPRHDIPSPDPWMIVETNGSTGQDIGTDGTDPTYRAYFPFPLNIQTVDQNSIDAYRRRELRIKRESLGTLDAVRDEAQAALRRRRDPSKTIVADANSLSAHNLSIGDGVDVDYPDETASGLFAVIERSDTFDGRSNRLDTLFELQEVATL